MSIFATLNKDNNFPSEDVSLIIDKLEQIRLAIVGKNSDIKRFTYTEPNKLIPGSDGDDNPLTVSPISDMVGNHTEEIASKYTLLQIELMEKNIKIQEEQLHHLGRIDEALNPRSPRDLEKTKAKQFIDPDEGQMTEPGWLSKITDLLPSLAIGGGAGAMTGKGKDNEKKKKEEKDKKTGKGKRASPTIPPVSSGGSGVSKALMTGSSILTAGVMSGIGVVSANNEKSQAIQNIQDQVDSGEISTEEGETLADLIVDEADKKKAGAVTGGVSALAGDLVGTKIGAAVGTMIMPGVGTIVGGLIGGVAGAAAGYYGGSQLGDKAASLVSSVKNFFGIEKEKPIRGKTFNETLFAKSNPQQYAEYKQYKEKIFKEMISTADPDQKNDPEYIKETFNAASKIAQERYLDVAIASNDIHRIKSSKNVSVNNVEGATNSVNTNIEGATNSISNSIEPVTGTNRGNISDIIPMKSPQSSILNDRVNELSVTNIDRSREISKTRQEIQPIISSTVSNNESTTFTSMKTRPRAGDSMSALDRYQAKTTSF